MSGFGSDDPREMPAHFFHRALRVNYETAVRAGTDRQNCSICPRYWYVDAILRCDRCGAEFPFSAAEQRAWYEDYGFWVDSLPRHCLACRGDLRNLKAVRQEYDQSVAHVLRHGDLASKRRLATVIDQLYELGGKLPPRINENRRQLANQIAAAEAGAAQVTQMDEFLQAALEEAKQGLAEGGIPIGAVLVHQGRILGRGHNRRVQQGSAILHAEMDALERAGRQRAEVYRRSTLYTTLSPCAMCSGAVLLYGIPRVVIGENRTFRGEEEPLRARGVTVEIIDDQSCRELLAGFVQAHPEIWDEDIGR